MSTFATPGEAKESIINRIVKQASAEGVVLTEIERRMLDFSEAESAPPEIAEASEVFDREYDQTEYEKKIVKLICHIRTSMAKGSDEARRWDDAVRVLREEDRYLLVIIDQACPAKRAPGDLLKLCLTALLIVGVTLAVALSITNR